ncbi:MAG: hypothetical protein AAGG11_19480 [Pseudomonadota bacterium]
MLITVRVYENETSAGDAAARLTERGFRPQLTTVLTASQGEPAQVIRAAVQAENLPREYRTMATRLLEEGKSIVAVFPPFGSGLLVESLLDEFNPIADVDFPFIRRYSPAPLSDLLGVPVLSDEKTFGDPLLSSNPAPLSSRFGWGLLSSNSTPLSSRFGMKLLSKPKENWKSSFGMPLLSNPKGNWQSSFGFPMLSKNPTPLSSLFGFALLSEKNTDEGLFGFPRLINNPTPLSSLLGMPILTNEAQNEGAKKKKPLRGL